MANIGFSETLAVAFKSGLRHISDDELADAAVALANTDGGVIYVGVEQDGEMTGLCFECSDALRIIAAIANNTVPPIHATAEYVREGVPVVAVSIPKADGVAATASGKVLRRALTLGGSLENVTLFPSKMPAHASERQIDPSAQPVPGAAYDDLDPAERERLRATIRARGGETALLSLKDMELDETLRLAVPYGGRSAAELVPTLAGLLVIGRPRRLRALVPTAETSVQALRGSRIETGESFVLPVPAAIERLSAKFGAWNGEEAVFDGTGDISVPDFDLPAFHEALANAYCHRDYSMPGSVRVLVGDEGLTVSSPGRLPDGVSPDRMPSAEARGRNPALAEALKRAGVMERAWRGIDRIFYGSLRHGKPAPDYSKSTGSRTTVFFTRGGPDKAFIRMLASEQQRTGEQFPINALYALNALKMRGRATEGDIVADAGVAKDMAKSALAMLTESGVIADVGGSRVPRYELSQRAFRAAGLAARNSRQPGAGVLMRRAQVMELALRLGSVTRSDVVNQLNMSPPQAFRVLHSLTDDGKLVLNGIGRCARYAPTKPGQKART